MLQMTVQRPSLLLQRAASIALLQKVGCLRPPALQLAVMERWHTRTAGERWALLKLSGAWAGREAAAQQLTAVSLSLRLCAPLSSGLLSHSPASSPPPPPLQHWCRSRLPDQLLCGAPAGRLLRRQQQQLVGPAALPRLPASASAAATAASAQPPRKGLTT